MSVINCDPIFLNAFFHLAYIFEVVLYFINISQRILNEALP